MPSLTTPVSKSPMGAISSGTDKPYRKIIFDVDIYPTLDQIEVSLAIGCSEDEDWTDEEKYIVQHMPFEKWLEQSDKLAYDDTHYVAAFDGQAVEMGEAYAISYTDYITEHRNPLDMIEFMKAKKIIPDYIIDPSLIKINLI